MGKIITARFSEIYPGEDFCHNNSLAGVVLAAQREPVFIIPVRKFRDKYVNLDGRHRLIYHKLTGSEEIELFLAEHPKDFITKKAYQHRNFTQYMENNRNVQKRWDWVERDESNRYWVRPSEFTNYDEYFSKLQQILPHLKNFDACMSYLTALGYIRKNYKKTF